MFAHCLAACTSPSTRSTPFAEQTMCSSHSLLVLFVLLALCLLLLLLLLLVGSLVLGIQLLLHLVLLLLGVCPCWWGVGPTGML